MLVQLIAIPYFDFILTRHYSGYPCPKAMLDELKKRFGSLVAANRRQKGWTQRQLAEEAELTGSVLSDIQHPCKPMAIFLVLP